MKYVLLLASALALAFTLPVSAERIAIESATRGAQFPRPERGMTMTAVQAKFGEPRERVGPVGEPPITRWNYDRFSVFFENDRVIHTVVKR